MRIRWGAFLLVLFALLAIGILYLIASPPRGEAIALHEPPTPAPLLVHIVGAVTTPGLYSLPINSRVQDAVEAAGGFTGHADSQAINLAARVQDGERITIPSLPPTPDPAHAANLDAGQEPLSVPDVPGTTDPLTSQLININTATQELLEELPGVGPVTAAKIIAYREEFGPFPSIEAIQEVSGIGPVKFAGMKDLITVVD